MRNAVKGPSSTEVRATVSAVIPHYDSRETIEQAVESLLNQTRPVDAIYVVSDGDVAPPWIDLPDGLRAQIRGVHVDVQRGPFAAVDLAFRASDSDYMLIQDADDWSEPTRLEVLLDQLQLHPSCLVATSAQIVHEGTIPELESLAQRYTQPLKASTAMNRFRHHALYRRQDVLELGGYYGGFPFGYDAYLTGLYFSLHRSVYVDLPLYNRRVRPGSLTQATQSGHGSAARVAVGRLMGEMLSTIMENLRKGYPENKDVHAVSMRYADTAALYDQLQMAKAVSQLQPGETVSLTARQLLHTRVENALAAKLIEDEIP